MARECAILETLHAVHQQFKLSRFRRFPAVTAALRSAR